MAVIGSGVSGLTAAYLLTRTAQVTLFESADRIGGHVHTHHTTLDDGSSADVDSGFIVCNNQTYPTVLRLFDELGVALRPTEMSMAIRCDGCGLQFVGGRGLGGVFAQHRRLVDPRFWRLLYGVRRFQRLALRHLADDVDDSETYGEFLSRHGFGTDFVNHYAVPVVSCVWSSGHDDALRYPAGYLFAFLRNHGFLRLKGAPQWYVVEGGSSSYVDRILATLDDVATRTPVTAVTRHDEGVTLSGPAGELGTFDAVVVATHADIALGMLADATADEKEVLGAFGYSSNTVVLHRDDSVLPASRAARGAWNYRMGACETRDERVQASYWMNRLQHLDERSPLVVTLNPDRDRPPEQMIAEMSYTHPVYTAQARRAQRRLAKLNSAQVAFAGAYHGWGFHEDGCRAGVAAARHFGVEW
ncbi:MAG: uncharacterized protein QOI06_3125 [Nocardioidaceae bacterium]|jgi:predicted NAD/FAD-binding protein|nr:uncharacterized protein [Nocardioidaceae bacterium]